MTRRPAPQALPTPGSARAIALPLSIIRIRR
jgi:hypothetical protein